MKQLKFWPMTRREAGRAGYLATVRKMGQFEFHHAGGEATNKIYGWSCPCHGSGVFSYEAHQPLKGKKHRY